MKMKDLDVISTDWGNGCKALFNLTDLIARPVKFLEISHVDYWGFDLNYSETSSLEDCRVMCLEDEACVAFTYWNQGDERRCFTKYTLFNGYRSPNFQGSTFLKLPENLPVPESGTVILNRSNFVCPENVTEIMVGSPYDGKTRNKLIWVYLYSFCAAVGVFEVFAFVLGWWALFSKHGIPASIENGYCMLFSQFRSGWVLCSASLPTHCPADVKDTETTLVQSPASTLAHSLVGRRLLA
nr:putative receptor protein kinase ZmPK1 [Ipomoea batatas]